jgi:hypothetical protein
VILHPDPGSLENFHGLPPFGFGFDIGEPAGVNIRYTFYICNNFNSFDSWTSGKISVVETPSNLGLILEHITALIEVLIILISANR